MAQEKRYRIGEWRVDTSLNAIQRGSEVIRLEPKVIAVLEYLMERPGEVVTKDELLDAVWPGVHVGEDVIAQAISKLRLALGDDRHDPTYIETVWKRGYRMLADVERLQDASKVIPFRISPARGSWLIAAVMVVAALVGAWILYVEGDMHPPVAVSDVLRLTSHPDNEGPPNLSPDGKRVVFARDGEEQSGIFLIEIGDSLPRRLTRSPGRDVRPVWRGRDRIAFLRREGRICRVMMLVISARVEREVGSCTGNLYPDLTASEDGRALALGLQPDGGSTVSIHRSDGDDLDWERVSTPPESGWGDFDPSFSPDGATIAFTRAFAEAMHDLYVVGPAGDERRVTHNNRNILGHDWLADGRWLVAAIKRGGTTSLWQVAQKDGRMVPLYSDIADFLYPNVDRSGRWLVAVRRMMDTNIWTGSVAVQTGEDKSDFNSLVRSTQREIDARPSPDGTRLAFVANRGSSYELWLRDLDSGRERQLTRLNANLVSTPAWSPDGGKLLFAVRRDDQADIVLLNLDDDSLTERVADGSRNLAPSWAPDGRSFYFTSDRSGRWQIWHHDIASSRTDRVADLSGAYAMLGSEGSLFFSRFDQAGIWRKVPGRKDPVRLTDRLDIGDWANWALTRDGILYFDRARRGLVRLDPATGEQRMLRQLDQRLPLWDPALSFSPDGRQFYASVITREDSDLFLFELEPTR